MMDVNANVINHEMLVNTRIMQIVNAEKKLIENLVGE